MASDRVWLSGVVAICVMLGLVCLCQYGIWQEEKEQNMWLSAIIVPATGDFDGEGLNNDVVFGYCGRLVFVNGDLNKSLFNGRWDTTDSDSGNSFYNNRQINNLSGFSV
jgi:hypothetical protein